MDRMTRGTFLKSVAVGSAAAAAWQGGKGKWFPSEARKYRDPDTGREVLQLTNSSNYSGNLYFTAQSFTRDNRRVVFLSNRPAKTELYLAELETGRFQQLTEAETGAYHACVCQKANTVAYLDNSAVWILDLSTLVQRKLYSFPKDHRPDLLSIDDDGKYIAFAHCVPLEKPLGPDQTHHSWLIRINTDGSGSKVVHEEDYWISHVIINPADPDTILFCHEGSWEVVAQRLWLVQADGSRLRKIRVEPTPEWAIGHEHWTEHGEAVGYHGFYRGRAFLGRIKKDGTGMREYTMASPSGHTSATEDGRMALGDGGVEYPFISLYHFKGQFAIPEVLCNSGRVNRVGVHPHANFSSDGKYVVFASERGGQSNVYVVGTGA
jgi:oligogalacturonide lyase